MEGMFWWLKEQKAGIWKRPQAEETTNKGWCLYSHRNIGQETLKGLLENQLGVAISLRYRAIFHGAKGTKTNQFSQFTWKWRPKQPRM